MMHTSVPCGVPSLGSALRTVTLRGAPMRLSGPKLSEHPGSVVCTEKREGLLRPLTMTEVPGKSQRPLVSNIHPAPCPFRQQHFWGLVEDLAAPSSSCRNWMPPLPNTLAGA